MKEYTKEEIENYIKENPIAMIYFSGGTCSACPAIKEKIKIILGKYEKTKFLDIEAASNLEISAMYNAFSVPVSILFIDGKEALRYGRNIDFMEFEKSLSRYYELIF
ncbi:MAG: thioredoxin family protein [Sarcina sp.]